MLSAAIIGLWPSRVLGHKESEAFLVLMVLWGHQANRESVDLQALTGKEGAPGPQGEPGPQGLQGEPFMTVDWAVPANSTILDGTWRVGPHIEPGLYRAIPPDEGLFSGCYWARLRGLTGNFDEIIANDNTQNPTYVRILDTDTAFESEGCGTWSKAEE